MKKKPRQDNYLTENWLADLQTYHYQHGEFRDLGKVKQLKNVSRREKKYTLGTATH